MDTLFERMSAVARQDQDRQFVAVKFRADDTRLYTYHFDGPPDLLAVGDKVKVPAKQGDGWNTVIVAQLGVEKPTGYATKGIMGKVELFGIFDPKDNLWVMPDPALVEGAMAGWGRKDQAGQWPVEQARKIADQLADGLEVKPVIG